MAPRPNHAERCRQRLAALAIAVLSIAGVGAVPGRASAAESPPPIPLVIDVDAAKMITMREPVATVSVANPDIADVQVPGAPNATRFVVFGRKVGSTTIFTIGRSGNVHSYAVTVRHRVDQIAAALAAAVPSAHVDVASAPTGITVSGTVASPQDAQRLKAAAKQFLGEKESLSFNVTVAAATQVNLRVRVAEVSRSADKQFGINWSALSNSGTIAFGLLSGRAPVTAVADALTGRLKPNFADFAPSPTGLNSLGVGYRNASGSVNVSGLIDALATEGLVTVLAEPNLTAISGESASFLAGGEFPVPVPQGLQQITIEWKKFGVSLEFTPTVLDAGRLSIKVRPEVSELTTVGSVIINGTTIPGLAVRRAETTVELASGQSFAVAGLFQNNASNQIQRLPGLGDLPVLGALFRSSRFQRNESELVIIVTPYIVQPVAQPGDLHLPTDGVAFAGDLEQVLLGRLTTRHPPTGPGVPATPATPHLQGDAGFILER